MNRCLLMVLLAAVMALSGCARGGEGGPSPVPEAVLDIYVRMTGPVRDHFYYYVAFDTDDDAGADFPVPVAAGPYWGNGWGTGSITYFLEYHNGQYNLFAANLNVTLEDFTGGFVSAGGTVTGHDTGVLRLTVTDINLGSATLAGTGSITGVTNDSDQNAGVITLETDAAGKTVAGTVSFTPAADGSRDLDAAEQAQLDALNAGGVTLASDSLDEFGITLTISAAAGAQTITIDPAEAELSWSFTAASTGAVVNGTATLTCNSSTPTGNPPIPGLEVGCDDMSVGDTATIALEISELATFIGPPYDYVVPVNSSILRATIDIEELGGHAVDNLSINFITTTELIFDPSVVDPDQHVYDALGPLGNDAILLYDPWEFRSIDNDEAFVKELAGDTTLVGPATQDEKDAVDIIDWSVSTRRLR